MSPNLPECLPQLSLVCFEREALWRQGRQNCCFCSPFPTSCADKGLKSDKGGKRVAAAPFTQQPPY
eukprot:1158529-Pelagomonas_calceolata.AAC.17